MENVLHFRGDDWQRQASSFCDLREVWEAESWEWEWKWIDAPLVAAGGGYLRLSPQLFPRRSHHREEEENNTIVDWDCCADDATQTATEFLEWEFHIFFDATWSLPALYARARRLDGTSLSLGEHFEELGIVLDGPPGSELVSQDQHPLLGTPFLLVHSCCLDQKLGALPPQSDRLLSWFACTAPLVGLTISPRQWSLLCTKQNITLST